MNSPQTACQQAIAAAETAHQVPTGLLLAIGRVESGRLDGKTGAVQPWPWTIDIDGKGTFFDNRPDAIAFVENAQAQGIQSIDVGCMQVNLLQHPNAFANLEDAFDPAINANYAARFLVELQHQAGDWISAAGLYHSRTETIAAPYRAEVVERFGGALGPASPALPPPPPRPADLLAAAWAATLGRQAPAPGSLHLWPKLPQAQKRSASRTSASLRMSAR